MIRIENLSKTYDGAKVLDIETLTISAGEHFGLVGNNGAGKTTLFSLLLDLIQPTSGQVTNAGIEVSESENWKSHTAAFIDEHFLIDYLTPEEYFRFIGRLRKVEPKQIEKELEGFLSFFNDEVLNQNKYIRDMSKGNQKKIGIAATFIGSPSLIVLDEPFANLDPSSQIRLKQVLSSQANAEKTLLISSHDLNHVTEVCERIVLLEKGQIKKDIPKTPQTLRELELYFSGE